jgi:hypothetical protein
MAATAEVVATNAAAEASAGAAAKPVKTAPTKADAPEQAAPGDEQKGKEKPKAVANTAPADKRESNIQKFARAMNATAEKDGVEVTAPEAERRAKPGPKPGTKRAAKPEAATETPAAEAAEPAAQANPKPKAEAAPAETEADGGDGSEVDEDADTGKPEPRGTHQLKAKARLRHGDVDKAIKIAFGDLRPEEFEGIREGLARKLGVSSKEWADFRRFQKDERAKSSQLHANATELSQRLQRDFEPMIQARKAYAAKDYTKALELVFPGENINELTRKAMHQHLSADPEKTRLAQQLDAMKTELAELKQGRQKPEQDDPRAQQLAALNREAQSTFEKLSQSEDGELAHFAKQKPFIRRVVELRGEHYDPHTKTTIPLHVAADMARDEFKQRLEEWRYDPTASGAAAPSSESPGLAGNEPVRTSAPRARSPIPSQAAQAGGSTRSLSRDERIRAFAARMG